jgi:hypothetical protein
MKKLMAYFFGLIFFLLQAVAAQDSTAAGDTTARKAHFKKNEFQLSMGVGGFAQGPSINYIRFLNPTNGVRLGLSPIGGSGGRLMHGDFQHGRSGGNGLSFSAEYLHRFILDGKTSVSAGLGPQFDLSGGRHRHGDSTNFVPGLDSNKHGMRGWRIGGLGFVNFEYRFLKHISLVAEYDLSFTGFHGGKNEPPPALMPVGVMPYGRDRNSSLQNILKIGLAAHF